MWDDQPRVVDQELSYDVLAECSTNEVGGGANLRAASAERSGIVCVGGDEMNSARLNQFQGELLNSSAVLTHDASGIDLKHRLMVGPFAKKIRVRLGGGVALGVREDYTKTGGVKSCDDTAGGDRGIEWQLDEDKAMLIAQRQRPAGVECVDDVGGNADFSARMDSEIDAASHELGIELTHERPD